MTLPPTYKCEHCNRAYPLGSSHVCYGTFRNGPVTLNNKEGK